MVGPWGYHGMMGGRGLLGGGVLALLSCVVFLALAALVVWLIVRLSRSATHPPAQISAPPPASPLAPQVDPVLETLRRRLAEGAITPEEFDQLREKLGV
jgi:uncharacterized membrane protein